MFEDDTGNAFNGVSKDFSPKMEQKVNFKTEITSSLLGLA